MRLRRRYGHADAHAREQRYIAKCKACGVVTSGLTSGQNMRMDKNDPKRTGDVYSHINGSLVLDCRKCGQPKYAKLVQGKYNPKIACNARCMSSTGTTCECSCGGKNHGGAHSAGNA